MPTQLQPATVEQALIKALKDALADPAQTFVSGVSSRELDADGNLVLRDRRAVLVLIEGGDDVPTRDVVKITYDSSLRVVLLIGEQNFAGTDKERGDALGLVGEVRNAIAGIRLDLEEGQKSAPLALAGWERFQFDKNGTWYAQNVQVEALAQFDVKG